MKYIRLTLLIIFVLITIFILPAKSFAQEKNIVPYLTQIEQGKKEEAIRGLLTLKNKNPNDPSVLYLEGVLTEKASDAVKIYRKILDKYPKSKYADASLYRILTYNYALGNYTNAKNDFEKLKDDYPQSPYIKLAERDYPSGKVQASNTQVAQNQNNHAKEEKEEKLENKPNYKFTIQAGAFTQPSNATELKKSFEANGYSSEIKDKIVGGTLFKVVYVGKFENKDDAESFLKTINSEFKLDGRIVNLGE